jgi:hypothetical protein
MRVFENKVLRRIFVYSDSGIAFYFFTFINIHVPFFPPNLEYEHSQGSVAANSLPDFGIYYYKIIYYYFVRTVSFSDVYLYI